MVDYKPENKINKLRHTINSGRYGLDYTIISRDKNNLLREEYLIDDCKFKIILLDLMPEDYIESDYSNKEYFPNDMLYIFGKDVQLLPRCSPKLEYKIVRLYIKFTWTCLENSKNDVKFLFSSFHKWEDI